MRHASAECQPSARASSRVTAVSQRGDSPEALHRSPPSPGAPAARWKCSAEPFLVVLGRRERTEPAWLADRAGEHRTNLPTAARRAPTNEGLEAAPGTLPSCRAWSGCAHSAAPLGAQTPARPSPAHPSQACPPDPSAAAAALPKPCRAPQLPAPLTPALPCLTKAPLAPRHSSHFCCSWGFGGFFLGLAGRVSPTE